MTKVFISWSGQTSHDVAQALYSWLPVILNSIEPFISSDSLQKGGRWQFDLADELEKSSFGILCLTEDNLQAPWLMFEAGALSKVVTESHVAPYLFGVKPSDLAPPLAQFNATHNEKEDFRKLMKSINAASEVGSIKEDLLNRSFENAWPRLQEDLENIKKPPPPLAQKTPRDATINSFDTILQELLTLARHQSQILKNPQQFIPAEELIRAIKDDGSRPSLDAWKFLVQQLKDMYIHINSGGTSDLKHRSMTTFYEIIEVIQYISRKSIRSNSLSKELSELMVSIKDMRQKIESKIDDVF